MTVYAPLLACLVTIMVMAALLASKASRGITDIPNERSLHTRPVPRVGGLALMAGVLAGWLLLREAWPAWLLACVAGLVALSALDDVRGLPVKIRLAGHLLAAMALVAWLGVEWLLWLPLVLAVAWMTNLYNFMDGSDGLAGGMALAGFGYYGAAAWLHGDMAFAAMNFSVCAAALGFLFFNFYPARVFMGDAGSIPLGFLAAAFGLAGWRGGMWPLWFPLLVFSPFVVDASVTLVKRVWRREKLSQAHRSHYYQRLVQLGWGHARVAWAEYGVMALAGGSALWGAGQGGGAQALLALFWLAAYGGIMFWVDGRWARREG